MCSPADKRRGKAGDRARTGNIQLGRLTLYQLSYARVGSDSSTVAQGFAMLC